MQNGYREQHDLRIRAISPFVGGLSGGLRLPLQLGRPRAPMPHFA
jgi:hypothetical protein